MHSLRSLCLVVVVVLAALTLSARGLNGPIANAVAPITNHDVEVCSSRADCCKKAIATLRNLIKTDTNIGPSSTGVYTLCDRGYTYVVGAAGDKCIRSRKFEPAVTHAAYANVRDCLKRNGETAGSLSPLTSGCLAPFMQAHERCISEVFDVCLRGTTCSNEAGFPFSDWNSGTAIPPLYPNV